MSGCRWGATRRRGPGTWWTIWPCNIFCYPRHSVSVFRLLRPHEMRRARVGHVSCNSVLTLVSYPIGPAQPVRKLLGHPRAGPITYSRTDVAAARRPAPSTSSSRRQLRPQIARRSRSAYAIAAQRIAESAAATQRVAKLAARTDGTQLIAELPTRPLPSALPSLAARAGSRQAGPGRSSPVRLVWPARSRMVTT